MMIPSGVGATADRPRYAVGTSAGTSLTPAKTTTNSAATEVWRGRIRIKIRVDRWAEKPRRQLGAPERLFEQLTPALLDFGLDLVREHGEEPRKVDADVDRAGKHVEAASDRLAESGELELKVIVGPVVLNLGHLSDELLPRVGDARLDAAPGLVLGEVVREGDGDRSRVHRRDTLSMRTLFRAIR